MRIINLTVDNFKIIKGLELNLDEHCPVNVFIGNNGSGKSTLLEIIAIIFEGMFLGKDLDFSFSIEYVIEGNNIKIDYEKGLVYKPSLNNKLTGFRYIRPFLPTIFAYYAGSKENIKNIFYPFEERYRKATKNGSDITLRKMFYLRKEHIDVIFLSIILSNEEIKNELFKILKISSINLIEITLRNLDNKKRWDKTGKLELWGATGDDFKNFWKFNFSNSELPYFDSETCKMRIKINEFINNWEEGLQKLFAGFESFLSYELLDKIEIKVIKETGEEISFDDFSEGERQLILSLGIIGINKNALFLFDEADTYLHPSWQRHYIENIEKLDSSGQVFMTTHSPLVLSLNKNNLYVLENGKIKQKEDTNFYSDVNTILEEVMNVNRYPEKISNLESKFYDYILQNDVDNAKASLAHLKQVLKDENLDEEDHDLVLELSGMIYRMELFGYEENH